jgi:hypothetical protein
MRDLRIGEQRVDCLKASNHRLFTGNEQSPPFSISPNVNKQSRSVRDASFGWRAAFLPLKHTVLFYSLHPDRELV